jgi:hypothetical protein
VLAQERDVRAHLVGRQHVVDDRVDHRQLAVADARRAIVRMEPVLDTAVLVEVREAGEHAVRHQPAAELGADALRVGGELRRAGRTPGLPECARERGQRLKV